MNHSFLLNPSCSELVTFLGLTDIQDIRNILKDICKKFEYTVRLISSSYDPVTNTGLPVDIDKLDISRDVKVLTFGNFLIDPSGINLERALYERSITYEYYLKHKEDPDKLRNALAFLTNKKLPEDDMVFLVLMDTNNCFVEIAFQKCIGYDSTPGLSLYASEDKALNEYPILGNVYMLNTSKYEYKAFENGTTRDFEEWLRYTIYYNKKEIDKWVKIRNFEENYVKDFGFQGHEK